MDGRLYELVPQLVPLVREGGFEFVRTQSQYFQVEKSADGPLLNGTRLKPGALTTVPGVPLPLIWVPNEVVDQVEEEVHVKTESLLVSEPAVMFTGGKDHLRVCNDVQLFTPALDTWRLLAPLHTARASHCSVVLNRRVYVLGGNTAGRSMFAENSVEVFDGQKWEKGASMKTARYEFGAAVLNKRIIVSGGRTIGLQVTSSVESYDPATNSWTDLAPMQQARAGHALIVFKDELFAIGGQDTGVNVSASERFDPQTATWVVPGSCVSCPWGYTCASVFEDSLYMFGRNAPRRAIQCLQDGSAFWSRATVRSPTSKKDAVFAFAVDATIVAFDPENKKWHTEHLVDMPGARADHAAVAVPTTDVAAFFSR